MLKKVKEYKLSLNNKRIFRSIEVENIKNHEENVRCSNDIANIIRNKVADLIEKIKQEEIKLLNNVQEFNNAEQR